MSELDLTILIRQQPSLRALQHPKPAPLEPGRVPLGNDAITTSLDTLRLGRLGPRGGRALLLGLGAGAALAGLRLGVYALAAAVPGLSPAAPSFR